MTEQRTERERSEITGAITALTMALSNGFISLENMLTISDIIASSYPDVDECSCSSQIKNMQLRIAVAHNLDTSKTLGDDFPELYEFIDVLKREDDKNICASL
jgi:hypothetical protein